MLTLVLAYKTKNRRTEVPKVVYLGHDRSKAKKSNVPKGYNFIETQYLTPGFGRKWSAEARKAAKAAAAESSESQETSTPGAPSGESDPAQTPEGGEPGSDKSGAPASGAGEGGEGAGEGEGESGADAPDQTELPGSE